MKRFKFFYLSLILLTMSVVSACALVNNENQNNNAFDLMQEEKILHTFNAHHLPNQNPAETLDVFDLIEYQVGRLVTIQITDQDRLFFSYEDEEGGKLSFEKKDILSIRETAQIQDRKIIRIEIQFKDGKPIHLKADSSEIEPLLSWLT